MKILKRIANAAVRYLVAGISFFLPVKKNKVFVSSYYGRGYGDNPKYIVDELLQLAPEIEILWLVKSREEAQALPKQVKAVRVGSPAAVYHMATAKVWLDNCRRSYYYKKKSQRYIQTWHGFALKRIEADVAENLSKQYVGIAKKDSRAIDLLVSEAAFMTGIYKRAFWYDGQIVQWGSPRNDILICETKRAQCKQRVAEYYQLDSTTKMALYAPTFRSNRSLEPYQIDCKRIQKACAERFGGEFGVVIRLHPNIAQKSGDLAFLDDVMVDATGYPDMQELLAAVDVVISDYSSLMFDFALSEKPCFQFATDIEDYKADRNFYFQLDKLPFTVATNNDELVEDILRFDQKQYAQKLERFWADVGMVRSGDSSQKCANYIMELCTQRKNRT